MRSIPVDLSRPALLADRRAGHIIRGKIPNPALTHLPALSGQPLEVGELHGINEAGFIHPLGKDFVCLVCPEVELGNDSIG